MEKNLVFGIEAGCFQRKQFAANCKKIAQNCAEVILRWEISAVMTIIRGV
jgi:hypothetical protein